MAAVFVDLVLPAYGAFAEVRTYRVDAEKSPVVISVGRAGLLRFAGHEHEVAATLMNGEIHLDTDDIGRSTVLISFDAAALRITGKGDSPEDVPKVQARMVGPDVLDVARFPIITFRADSVDGSASAPESWDLQLQGELSLHGVTHRLILPVRAEVRNDTLRVVGSALLRQSKFGIDPVSVAGVVKVKDELRIDFRIVAPLVR